MVGVSDTTWPPWRWSVSAPWAFELVLGSPRVLLLDRAPDKRDEFFHCPGGVGTVVNDRGNDRGEHDHARRFVVLVEQIANRVG
jgi:hypothetical protein